MRPGASRGGRQPLWTPARLAGLHTIQDVQQRPVMWVGEIDGASHVDAQTCAQVRGDKARPVGLRKLTEATSPWSGDLLLLLLLPH
jgi:hypothetical protein